MEFGPEDLFEFGRYYLPSLIVAGATTVAILVALIFGRRFRAKSARHAVLTACLVVAPLVCWTIYFAATAGLTSTLILLGSESSEVAERAYFNRFGKQVNSVDAAVRLAVNKHQESNVRFYASCLVADMLATNDDATAASVLKKVESAPIIETEFFGGNGLTEKFYIPGRAQVHLPVRDIIEQRLREHRQATPP